MKRPSLNHAYRLVWSDIADGYIAVAECIRARGKRAGGVAGVLVAASLLGAASPAHAVELGALPTGGAVAAGSGSISQSGSTMTITQASDRMVANWNTFNIGQDASVNFQQPSALSVALNRIYDTSPSQILGHLNANGQVYLLNPSGIIFGQSAQVDVGGLVASTLDMSDADFMAGRNVFINAGGAGSILNQGNLNGKVVALIAPQVRNEGTITADTGSAIFAAGDKVSLDFVGDNLVNVTVDQATINALVENKGLIRADGGMVVMTAQSANALLDTVVNNEGVIQANALAEKNGRIVLDGGGAGITRAAGVLDASDDNGTGGRIVVTGDKVLVDEGARLDASGKTGGGEVLVGGGWQGGDPAVRQATATVIASTATLDASATDTGNGGTVVAWSDITNPNSVTRAYGTFLARGGANGGDGGRIETSGHWLDTVGVKGDAAAPHGLAGTWLFDPYNVTITTATANNTQSSGTWTPSANNSTILNTSINSLLEGGTSVTVTTGSSGSQNGDITVSSTITKASGNTDVTLTLQAANVIVVDQAISNTGGTGKLHVTLDADNNNGSRDGVGIILLNNDISTGGGNISFGTGATMTINGVTTKVGGDVYVAGAGARALTTGGGNVTVNGEMILANTSGLTISTSNGNVTFGGLLNSGNSYSFVQNWYTGSVNSTWTNAKTNAISGTGSAAGDTYLATITSRLENAVASRTAGYVESWLGGRRVVGISTDSDWRWVTGPEGLEDSGNGRRFFQQNSGSSGGTAIDGGYSNWSSGEPNNWGGSGPAALNLSKETAASLTGSQGQWNDLSASSSEFETKNLPYIKETNASDSPLTVNAGTGMVTFSGAVGGSKALSSLNVTAGTIAINGGGVTTDGAQTYTGAVTTGAVTTLSASSITTSSTVSASSYALTLAADALTLGGSVSGTGALTIQPKTASTTIGVGTGTGTLSLPQSYFWNGSAGIFGDGFSGITIGSASQTGAISVNGLTYSDPLTLYAGGAGGTVSVAGTVTDGAGSLAGALTLQAASTVSGAANITTHGQNLTVNTGGSGSGTLSGVLAMSTGGLTKLGSGTTVLSGANTYTGASTISAGTLSYGASNVLSDSTAVTVASGATYDLAGYSDTIGSLAGAGNVTLGSATLTAGGDNTSTTLSGVMSGTGGLTKAGSGTMTLSGANTYTGATAVNAGTLTLSNTNQSASYTITSGAVLDLNVASGTRDSQGTTFSGSGTLRKSGAGTIQWGGTQATFNLGSGALIDVQEGQFTGGHSSNEVWTSNLSDLNVESGAIFDGVEANVRVDALTGAGTIKSSYNGGGYQKFTFGVDNGSGSFSGVLADSVYAANYVKEGSGTQTLTGANTYTGATTVSAGTLVITNDVGLGTTAGGTTVASGATLDLQNVTVGAEALTLNGGTLGTSTGTSSLSGAITLGADSTVSVGGTQLTLSGVIDDGAGAYGLTKAGSGMALFSGANTYDGATTVSAGTLRVDNSAALGSTTGATTVASGATLTLNNVAVGAEALTLAGGTLSGGATGGASSLAGNINLTATSTVTAYSAQPLTLSGIISGNFDLWKQGSGTLILSGSNTYTGTTYIQTGTLAATHDNALGTTAGGVTLAGGATLDLQNVNVGAEAVTTSGGSGAAIIAASSGTSSLAGNITLGTNLTANVSGTQLTLSGVIDDGAGTRSLTKSGSGTLVLSGANTYDGTTTVSAGTLAIGNATGLGTTTGGTTVASGTTLDFRGVTVGGEAITLNGGTLSTSTGTSSLSGNVTLGADSTLSVGGTQLTLSGVVDDGTGAYGLTKTGSGTAVLSGANTYDGATTVSAGTLAAANASALGSTTGGTTVTNGASLLLNGVAIGNESVTINGTGVGGAGALQGSGTASLSGTVTANTTANVGGSGSLTLGAITMADGQNLTLGTGGAHNFATGAISGTSGGSSSNFTVNTTGSASLGTVGTDIDAVNIIASNTTLAAVTANTIAITDSGASGVTLNGVLTANANNYADSLRIVTNKFTNNYGAGALATPNGTSRWLVWSGNPANDTRGGLSYGFKQYNATYGSSTVLGSGNGFLYTLAPTVIASLTGTVSKTYDGNTSATLAAGNYSVSGAVDGDTVAFNNPTSGSYDNRNAGTGKAVTVNGVSIGSATNGSATVYGYQLAGSSINAAVGAITPRTLTVGYTGVNKVYDGGTTASVTTSDDRVTGDTLTIARSAAFADKIVATGKTVSVTGVSLSGADAGNYSVAATGSTTADIAARTLNVVYTGVNKIFDGTTAATVTTSDDRVTDDVLAISRTAAFADPNVGVGKPVAVTGVSLGGADAGNYAVVATGSTTADITVVAQAPSDVTSSVTSPQQGITGTSDTSGVVSGSGTIAGIGPGTGGGTLQQQGSTQLVSDNTAAPGGMTLNSREGGTGVSFSEAGSTMTLDLASGEAGAPRQSFLRIVAEGANQANDGETVEVVDRGNSLSLTPTERVSSEAIQITDDSGPSTTGVLMLSDGGEVPMTVKLLSEGVLLVTLPTDAPGIEPIQVSMIGLALVNKDLGVGADRLTAIVIRRQ